MKHKWMIAAAIVAALLCWRIVVVSMADHYVREVKDGSKEAIDKALFWNGSHPVALFYKAEQIYKKEPDRAIGLLQKAIDGNPADSRPLLLLARILHAEGQTGVADSMIDVATRIMPVNPAVLKSAAQYWYSRGDLNKAVLLLSTALEADPSETGELLPIFLEIAENPTGREALREIALAPPKWWDRFFLEVVRRALETDTVRALYGMRQASTDFPITGDERNAYIKRLQKDGFITEAYLVWVNGLDKVQRQELGYLYNGSFEQEFTNAGFDWHATDLKRYGITLNTAQTYGIHGQKALHVAFTGKTFRFSHVYQPLHLTTGKYVFSGRVRTDKLQTRGGMQWRIRCTTGSKQQLVEGDRYLGSGEWIDFNVKFEVPDDCAGQELRLVSVGRRDVDHEMKGEIWFDKLGIRLLRD